MKCYGNDTIDHYPPLQEREIEKEVNGGKTFANLRQIYHSMILAAWYKQNLRKSLLGQVYMDKAKTKGVDTEDKTEKEKIYQQYLKAFQKGVFNYIKEDYDATTAQIIPRKYFSGGDTAMLSDSDIEGENVSSQKFNDVGGINLDPALLDLQIKRDGKGIPLPLPQQPAHMQIEGFLPVIINVTPIDLPLILELAGEENPTDVTSSSHLAPMALPKRQAMSLN